MRVCTQVSTELYNALAFVGEHPVRRKTWLNPPGGISQGEFLHLAHAALTFPAEEAVRGVQRYALCWVTFQVAYWESRHREARLGPGLTPAHYVMALAMEIVPKIHGEALTTLQSLAGLGRAEQPLEGGVPRSVRGFARTKEQPDGPDGERPPPLQVRRDEAKAEFNLALAELLKPLRETGASELLGKVLDGDPGLAYLPHAAKMDLLNRWKPQKRKPPLVDFPDGAEDEVGAAEDEAGSLDALAERIRVILGPARETTGQGSGLSDPPPEPIKLVPPGVGADRSVWRPEEVRAELGLPPGSAERLTAFLRQPPAAFLKDLTPLERRAFDALQSLWLSRQFSEARGVQTQIAEAADVLPPIVTRMKKKLRKALSLPS